MLVFTLTCRSETNQARVLKPVPSTERATKRCFGPQSKPLLTPGASSPVAILPCDQNAEAPTV